MKKRVEIINYNRGDDYTIKAELKIPSKCPICETAYGDEPVKVYRHDPAHGGYSATNSTAIYFCPHCEHFFYADYQIHRRYGSEYDIYYIGTYPVTKHNTKFSEGISELSPRFINVYMQAEVAEEKRMFELCGMGYRKALEILVKDFACWTNPEDEEKIKKMGLSQCIKNYIESSRIKTLATASAWIGNDETHYVRQNEEYDLEDLKLFIKSLTSFIESEMDFLKAKEFVEKRTGNKG